ncbi:MAG: mechanosensitive ion channel family protein [Acholeplasmataceae bacterium]
MNTFIEYIQDLIQQPFVGEILYTLLIFIGLFILLSITKRLIKGIEKVVTKDGAINNRLKTITKLLFSITKYVLWIVAIIVILAVWGVDVLPALAGLGIIGLVIGLGAQKMISDMIAGFFIIFENHYNVGENIEVAGFRGNVLDLGLKSTTIQGWKGEIKIFSNSEMTPVLNYSRFHSTAVVNFKVPYGTNLEHVIQKTNQALLDYKATQENILTDPNVVGVSDLLNTMIQLTIVCQTKANTQFGIEREIRKLVVETLKIQGVTIPLEDVVASHMEK